MSYEFTFDLSSLSKSIFQEIANFTEESGIPEKINSFAQKIVQKFNVDKVTGLPSKDSVTIIKDLIQSDIMNKAHKKRFKQSTKRLLLLPHCCRKYMDSRCKAHFDAETSSYRCKNCSKDCLVNKATVLAQKHNYDVYVVPGSSCVKRIFQKKRYDGVIGIACTEEISLALKMLNKHDIAVQSIPLIKNGCAGTYFDFHSLHRMMNNN